MTSSLRASGRREVIALTMGDPCGVGPEICLRAATELAGEPDLVPVIVGSEAVLRRVISEVPGFEDIRLENFEGRGKQRHTVESLATRRVLFDEVEGINGAHLATLPCGKVSGEAGSAAYATIVASFHGWQSGRYDAIATAPINKEALQRGGVKQIDHTGSFQHLAGAHSVWTLFEVDRLRIFFLTRHVSLRQALGLLSVERVHRGLVAMREQLRRLGWTEPRMAVAALNPHAGEGGLFGDEEETILKPGIERARQEGCRVEGPIPADAVFHLGYQGRFDAVLALYHDQGHIAAKTLDFERTVSITLGLPFIRTSVDHGTAFDIAGTGRASAVSMKTAVRAAAVYARLLRQHTA